MYFRVKLDESRNPCSNLPLLIFHNVSLSNICRRIRQFAVACRQQNLTAMPQLENEENAWNVLRRPATKCSLCSFSAIIQRVCVGRRDHYRKYAPHADCLFHEACMRFQLGAKRQTFLQLVAIFGCVLRQTRSYYGETGFSVIDQYFNFLLKVFPLACNKN